MPPAPSTAPFPSLRPADVVAFSNSSGSGVFIRNGTPASAEFGQTWKAQAEAENAERMAKAARAAAMPPLSDQLAGLAVELERHRAMPFVLTSADEARAAYAERVA